nr:protein zyg 11 protein B [Hymenolepis microstoma]
MSNSIQEETDRKEISLLSFCIETIVNNFPKLIITRQIDKKLRKFRRLLHPKFVFPASVAEKILKGLSERRKLLQKDLKLFSSRYVNLHSIFLSDIKLSKSHITTLRDFTLYNLTVLHVEGIDLANLVANFSPETKRGLHTLKVDNMKIRKKRRWLAFGALKQLRNLQVLQLIRTNLDSKYLRIIVRCSPYLTYLDISENIMDNISCLKALKDRLRVLIMHMITCDDRHARGKILSSLLQLKELRTLDVSNVSVTGFQRNPGVDQLIKPENLPHLRNFDTSGNLFGLSMEDIRTFIQNHPNLKFLGLALLAGAEGAQAVTQLSNEYPNIEEFDYKRCCKILFKFFPGESSTIVKERTLSTLWIMFGKMTDEDFAEVRKELQYMQCLIRCVAELHVPKRLVQEWLSKVDRGAMRYLTIFHNFDSNGRMIDCSRILSRFIGNSYQSCLKFVDAGGFAILRFIIRYSFSDLELLDNFGQLQEGHLLYTYLKLCWRLL